MKKKEVVKSAAGWLLAGVQVASDGLSSARQIVDFTSAHWARYAACGATIVEGEIYRKNIIEGFNRFSLLNKKSLLEYLIIARFEEKLISIKQEEKEIKKNLHLFLNNIHSNYELLQSNNTQSQHESEKSKEKEFLNKYNELLVNENDPLKAENQKEIEEYFSDFIARRSGTQSFVQSEDEIQFSNLKKNLEKLIFLKNSSFVKNYIENQQLLKQAELFEKESDVEKTKNRLKILRKLLIKSAVKPGSCELLKNEKNLSEEFINELKNEVLMKASKIWPLRFGMLFSLGVGVGTGVITFYTFPVVLMSFGLTSLTILSAVIWPLAILSAIAYAILIYNTITDLILNETLSKWWKELNSEVEHKYNGQLNSLKYICLVLGKALSKLFGKLANWFKFQEQENYFSYVLRMILSAAVLVFGIIAALTTGYTAFIQLQNYVSLSVCIVTALPLMLSDLLFTLKNSFETVGLLTGISIGNLLNPVKRSFQDLKSQIEKENYLQCGLHILRVPLKLMFSVLKLLIFGFHVFFTSVASDRFFNFPCWLTLFFAAGSELLTDICPLFGDKQDEYHNHDHGGIFNWINKIIFILPATLLGILNCLFSQLNRCTNSDTPPLGLGEAIKQEWQQFDIMHMHESISDVNPINIEVGKLSKQIVLQKTIHIYDKQINRLSNVFFKSNLVKQKIAIFQKYKEKLEKSGSFIELENNEKIVLGKHRFFNRGKTESMRKIEKIQTLIKDYVANDNSHVSNGCARIL